MICTKTVTRLTPAEYRGRKIVVKIEGAWLYVRLFGTRTTFRCPVLTVWWEAAKLFAREKKAERAAKRKAKKAKP